MNLETKCPETRTQGIKFDMKIYFMEDLEEPRRKNLEALTNNWRQEKVKKSTFHYCAGNQQVLD